MKRIPAAAAAVVLAVFGAAAHVHRAAAAATIPAAALIGAYAGPTLATWDTENTRIGSLGTQRIFYSGALPATVAGVNSNGESCAQFPANVTCVVSYKTPDTNVAAYVQSIPPTRNVIMIWHHEPENDTFTGPGSNGQNFVAVFVSQSALIRQAAAGAPNVHVAMAAEAYQYAAGTSHALGADCSFIPPAAAVDYYLADVYEPIYALPDGSDLPNAPAPVGDEWRTWMGCVEQANLAGGVMTPIGLAEYGLNSTAPDSVRAATLKADDNYLRSLGVPVALWEPWDYGKSALTGPLTSAQWQAIEAGN